MANNAENTGDPKQDKGSCDFIYISGKKKGKLCAGSGWRDGAGYRCWRHRATMLKSWYKSKPDSLGNSGRSTHETLLARIKELEAEVQTLRKELDEIQKVKTEPA
ncbi:MAG: hypothetical protein P4L67_03885 [Candidatus Pacebacteria bacterium]|nr:hypothetical protein [Candidatus Paceibacterota bacterium]